MSRLTINLLTTTSAANVLSTVPGAAVTVYARNPDGTAGAAAPVYEFADPSILTPYPGALLSDAQGRIPGWLNPGDYVITVTASGYTPYSEAYSVPGAGGATSGSITLRKFAFAYNTPNLLTGAPVYTPAIGEILVDGWIEIDTAWNGTTPRGDFGNFSAGVRWPAGYRYGWLGNYSSAAKMDVADDALSLSEFGNLLVQPFGSAGSPTSLVTAGLAGSGNFGTLQRVTPAKFVSTDPVRVVVSQDGTITGADPGSTQGAAILHLITAIPL